MVSLGPFSNEFVIPMAFASQLTSSTETPTVVFNIITQINEKLTPSTFPQWRAQFETLLIDYDLMDFISGISHCPPTENNPLAL